eukprot:COSAG01_NODE_17232_length_1167_cov_370.687266_3_plen_67_part_00
MAAQWHAAFVEGMKAQGKWVEHVRPKGKTVSRASCGVRSFLCLAVDLSTPRLICTTPGGLFFKKKQ